MDRPETSGMHSGLLLSVLLMGIGFGSLMTMILPQVLRFSRFGKRWRTMTLPVMFSESSPPGGKSSGPSDESSSREMCAQCRWSSQTLEGIFRSGL